MRGVLTAGALVLAGSAGASPIAEVICATGDDMTRRLTQDFGETRHALGLRGPGQVMEIWTGEGGDWTMVVRYSSGRACIVAMGEHWETLALAEADNT